MGSQAEKGQVLIELIVCALFVMGFFLLTVSLSETAVKENGKDRFQDHRRAR